jgi:copper/silver efflux system protein
LPADVHPAIGPDATGAGWVYEYVLVDHTHKYSLADLRTLQDWHLRYQLETVPGVAEVASIGGFVRQYQVSLDPTKLLAYGIPLSTVIDRVKSSTNEVGGRVLELSGTRYMIRGLGYLKSLADLENVSVMAKNGTPVLIKDLGRVSFGPDMREGVAEWQGEGETVGGIVVMRYGLNALTVIDGVKKKLAEIKGSLPPGVEVLSGYDRAGLIQESIKTLQRDLIEEAIIVSLVIIIFLFHFRSVYSDVLLARKFEHHVARWLGAGNWGLGRCRDCHGGERLSACVRKRVAERGGSRAHSHRCRQTSRSSTVLFAGDYRCLISSGLFARSTRGANV